MSKRKTKKEKLQSAERVRIQQEEYARLLKQKVDLREYKEGLLIRQDEMRRNFIAFELGLVCLLTSFFQVEKSFLENRKETTYLQKQVIFDDNGWQEFELGYVPKDTSLKEPVFYYQSEWTPLNGNQYANSYRLTIKDKKKLFKYLKQLEETNQIELPSLDVVTWEYRIEKIENINRSDQATLYAEYEYLDETKTVTIPITKEEKDSLAKQLKIFLSVLGLLGTPGIYAVSVNPYRSDINELKSRIRKLQKEQDKN